MLRDRLSVPLLITGSGLFFVLTLVIEGIYFLVATNPLGEAWLSGAVTSLPFILGLIYGKRLLERSDISPSRYRRIGLWTFGFMLGFTAMNLLIMVADTPGSMFRFLSWIRWALAFGGGIGLLIGYFEARGIQRAVAAERAKVRADEAEAKEDMLAYLNATLRHEILNTITIILGNADMVAQRADEDEIVDRMDTIIHNTQEMENVIEDVGVLLTASREETEDATVDITEHLAAEIETIEQQEADVKVTTDMPDTAMVQANQALRRGFANLLGNAVEHNDEAVPEIEVSVRCHETQVEVVIADNGPGIPEDEQATLFEREVNRDPNHGLGLALCSTLIQSYGGSIDLTETGPDGTVFTITLPRAEQPDQGEALTQDEPVEPRSSVPVE